MRDNPLIIKAVGDICPGDKSILGLGVCSLVRKYGPDFPFKYANNSFHDADIVIGNLEGVLSKKAYDTKETFFGVPEFAETLKKVGFNVITLANNHIMEKGVSGLNETVTCLQKAGLNICGLRGNNEYYSKPVILEKKGMIVGIISYNWVSIDLFPHTDQYIAQSRDSVVNYTWNRNPEQDKKNREKVLKKNINVLNDIRRLKKQTDFIIVMPHWGFEFVHYPPYGVILEARSFIDVGADLIIGIHPHVLQGIEKYNGKLIVYSLGNFVFDSRSSLARNGAILEYCVEKDGIYFYKFHYVRLNSRFQPVLLNERQKTKIENLVASSTRIITTTTAEELLNDDKIYREFEKKYTFLKWHTILYHLLLLVKHPALIRVILIKIIHFGNLILLRMRGEKIRW